MNTKKVQAPVRAGPSGSIIVWLGGLVFGVSAGLLLLYHFLTSSRSTSAVAIDVAQTAPVTVGNAKFASTPAGPRNVSSAHSEAMKAARKAEAQ